MLTKSLFAALACVARLSAAQVVGTASGAASGITGGGDATPAAPADIDELVEWLTDATPRVILIDKEFDFIGSEGQTTENGCRPDSNTCGAKGQDALDGPDWCSASYPVVEVTYDVAGTGYIDVKSDKSIVGVGDKGVVRGKGFRVANNVENVIFQNFHITELNPQYIWGGDAIQVRDSDMVWIDHMKISLVGRQMLVVQNKAGGRVTISNNDLDGETSWSASCNDQHYWTMMIIGEGDQVTLANNWVHSTSGRSPKVGAGTNLHAVNNLFENNGGHNFDAEDGATILLEGNVFNDCKAPLSAETLSHSSGIFNVPSASDASACSSALGRDCEINSLTNSGEFGSFTDTAAIEAVGKFESVWEAVAASDVSSANAGVGKLTSATAKANVVSKVATVEEDSEGSNSTAGAAAPSASAAAPSASASSETEAEDETEAPASSAAPAAPAATAAAEESTGSSSGEGAAKYGRCGGNGWDGATSCADGTCTVVNDWYSQCI